MAFDYKVTADELKEKYYTDITEVIDDYEQHFLSDNDTLRRMYNLLVAIHADYGTLTTTGKERY